ncbi:hypothetical protein [Pseudonocardia acaciae]|uniref:hypothetical protein n=1 Tax=Pseudonocardia acaciae TaxID=551276 RepID=UPI00068753FF|nr:hypothetical protein [Pseudonocardia acaciae]
MLTNREVYHAVLRAADGTSRTLEEYLLALWVLGRAERDRDSLPPERFAMLLTRAVSAPVPAFDDSWRTAELGLSGSESGFDAWERTILSQIADLRDFAEGPKQDYLELGVEAPRRPDAGTRANGPIWYNHSVPGYLECAMAGTLGGWDINDGIRKPVSVPTFHIYPEPDTIGPLPLLTWPDMTDFLICGQEYE